MASKWTFIDQALDDRDRHHRRRQLTPITPLNPTQIQKQGRTLINFSANDYLGLAKHPQVQAAAIAYTQRYGTSATASRLVAGTFDIHTALETRLAEALGYEAALLFGTGYQCNLTVLSTLADRHSLILCDRLCHNSLLQGARHSGARLLRFPHNDLAALEAQLQAARKTSQAYNRIFIVSETVFSMDGDRADVARLQALSDRYNAILYLDDAHALGVLGQQGLGLTAHQNVDIVVGTFGKAFGAFGAFVASSRPVCDYLINHCPGLIYTTALPPSIIGSIDAALRLIPTLETERQHLHTQADTLRQGLQRLGYDTAQSASPIIPAIVGPNERALALSRSLEDHGFLAIAIRPPTVPEGTARLRFALSCHHTQDQIEQLLGTLGSLSTEG